MAFTLQTENLGDSFKKFAATIWTVYHQKVNHENPYERVDSGNNKPLNYNDN